MKSKVLLALETKYKNLGLGKQTLEGLADYLSKTIKEESEIQTVVDNSAPLLSVFQKETDRRVTGLETELEEFKKKVTPPAGGNPPKPDDVPEYIKTLMTTVETLSSELKLQKTTQKVQELKESAKKLMIEKGVEKSLCEKILNRINPSDKDTAETLAEVGISEYNDFTALMFPGGKPPENPQGKPTETVIKDYFEEKKKEFEHLKPS